MRDFIKKQIQERMNIASTNTAEPENEVSNEAILEYASLFQELDDLSMEGTEAGNTRKLGMDIPLDDDAELESVEFDIAGGKVKDIPDTAAIQESYDGMKTFDKFYQEAYESLTRLPRESESGFGRRVQEYAEEMYNEYCAEAEACGYFGFDKINITDERVPSKMNVNFGAMGNGSNAEFVTKVNTFFATDEDHNITQKQLDSVNLVKQGAIKNIGASLKAYMESNYDVSEETSVWDVCTPKTIIVPKGNADSFCVVVEFMNEVTGKNDYFGWTAPVVSKTEEDNTVTMESCEKYNMYSFINETQYENRDKFIQEAAARDFEERKNTRVRPQRFFQEAIELGGDAAPAEGGDAGAAPAADDLGGGDTTSTDTATTDAPAEGGDANAADGEGEKKDNTAAVNDVSSEIAEKVANDTQNDAEANDEQVTFSDDEVNPDSNVGTADGGSIDDAPVEDDITGDESTEGTGDEADDMLNDLDTSSTTDTDDMGDESLDDEPIEGDEEGTGSVENVDDMSVNELLKMGTESLKNMKVGDLKNLIASGDQEAIQEAFLITPKNVNKELDVKLRDCLGVLNEKGETADKLLGKFRMKGHKLNRVLSKAAKMTKVYSSDEIGSIKKLNEALGQLLLALRKKGAENYGSVIKGKIKDFTKEAKKVGAIVEDKLGKNNSDAVVMQEAFLLNNYKDKITKALIPVKGNMEELKKLHDEGNLTRGRIVKKYSAKSSNAFAAFGYGSKSSNMPGADHGYSGYSKYALNIDAALKLLNKALRKKQGDCDPTLIGALADKLDLISDYIETVIDDTVENKEIVKRIGIISGEIIELIDQFIGDTTANATTDVETEEMVDPATNVEADETTSTSSDDDDDAEIEIPEEDESIEEEPEVEDDEEGDEE